MTNTLLSHEQGHYDITALGARELYNALLQLTAPSGHELQTRASQLRQRIQQKINRTNTRYDTQTNHSQNAAAQHTWQQRIAAEKQKPDGSIDNLPQ
jgi:predicted secreted Zn-dependent protease